MATHTVITSQKDLHVIHLLIHALHVYSRLTFHYIKWILWRKNPRRTWSLHLEDWIKWSTYNIGHFQTHLVKWKFLYSDSNFTSGCMFIKVQRYHLINSTINVCVPKWSIMGYGTSACMHYLFRSVEWEGGNLFFLWNEPLSSLLKKGHFCIVMKKKIDSRSMGSTVIW